MLCGAKLHAHQLAIRGNVLNVAYCPLIAVGFAANVRESVYRSSLRDVLQMMKTKHANYFLVRNTLDVNLKAEEHSLPT